jgi:tRNA (guanine-N7-)-methyltransferase
MEPSPEAQEAANPLPEAAKKILFQPDNFFARLPLGEMFPNPGPLEVDLGCGEGAFLTGMAARHPDRNFLGVERLYGRVSHVCRISAHQGLSNVRVLRVENSYLVEHMLPPESVSVASVLFPDPWPKRYHHPRRLIQAPFLRHLHRTLAPGGELHVKTDDQPYFLWMEKAFAEVPELERIDWPDADSQPVTNFERRFLNQGLPIYRARLVKR